MRVNFLIRRHGYSSSDITFRRDENTNSFLTIPDKLLADKQHAARLENQTSPKQDPSQKTSALWDIILLKNNAPKHIIREPFLMTVKDGTNLEIKKILKKTSSTSLKTSNIQ